MEQELRDRWTLVAGYGPPAELALAGLLARYREPHRHYHGLAHVVRVLRDVDELLGAVPVDDGDAVRLAAWFHDAVYDPRSSGNEAASARLAGEVLASLGMPADRREAVARLVLATATHEPGSDDEAVLVDADLAVLAADPSTYSAYAKGVRREYLYLDDASWRRGRTEVLRSFLARARIFTTDAYRVREPRARANLTAELAGLEPSALGPGRRYGRGVGVAPDTVVEALGLLAAEGYTADFEVRGHELCCATCSAQHPVGDLTADHVYRFEGMTDPGDEAIVIGLTCPVCGAKGAVVSAYGPTADPDELSGILMIAERYASG